MTQRKLIIFIFAFFVLVGFVVAQDNAIYVAKGFEFQYPKDWKLSDTSSGNVQQYRLILPNSHAMLVLISPNVKVADILDYRQIREQMSTLFFSKLLTSLTHANPETNNYCADIQKLVVPGKKIQGSIGPVLITIEAVNFVLRQRFFSIITVYEDSLSQKASLVTNIVGKSLTLDGHVVEDGDFLIEMDHPSVAFGKPIKIERPTYPSGEHRSSDVKIKLRILVDENGDVIWAKPDLEEPLFSSAATIAAKGSKFYPTKICGKPARSLNAITYSFETREFHVDH